MPLQLAVRGREIECCSQVRLVVHHAAAGRHLLLCRTSFPLRMLLTRCPRLRSRWCSHTTPPRCRGQPAAPGSGRGGALWGAAQSLSSCRGTMVSAQSVRTKSPALAHAQIGYHQKGILQAQPGGYRMALTPSRPRWRFLQVASCTSQRWRTRCSSSSARVKGTQQDVQMKQSCIARVKWLAVGRGQRDAIWGCSFRPHAGCHSRCRSRSPCQGHPAGPRRLSCKGSPSFGSRWWRGRKGACAPLRRRRRRGLPSAARWQGGATARQHATSGSAVLAWDGGPGALK